MKAALLYGVNDLRLVDVPVPVAGPGDVLVRVTCCGVCPTDLRKFRTGDAGSLKLPMNLGHEWVGEVVEVGREVSDFQVGIKTIGDTYDGYAEYALITAATRQLSFPHGPFYVPDRVPDGDCTFVEPLADCLHAVIDQGQVQPGQIVLIFGAGQMGLQLAAVAKRQGARVIVSEPMASRREYARRFGADVVFDPSVQDVVEEARAQGNGDGVDCAILSVGVPSLVNQALEIVRPLGRVVLFAGFERPAAAQIDPNLIHYKELIVVGSEWIGTPPYHRAELYQQAIDLIANGSIPVGDLIASRFPLERIQEAFAAAQDPTVYKVIVCDAVR